MIRLGAIVAFPGLSGCVLAVCLAGPGSTKDVMASCATPTTAADKFKTSIAPVTIRDGITEAYVAQAAIEAAARQTMEALGLAKGESFGCHFDDPSIQQVATNVGMASMQHSQANPPPGYRLVRIDRFGRTQAADASGPAQETVEPQAQSAAKGNVWICEYESLEKIEKWVVIESPLGRSEVSKQFGEYARTLPDFRGWPSCLGQGMTYEPRSFGSVNEAVGASNAKRPMYDRHVRQQFTADWRPKVAAPLASATRRAIVNFASPAQGERGYSGLAFDVEYQFLVCQGELHIAYSLAEDSVRRHPGWTLPASYLLDGKHHLPTASPTKILSVPLTGTVSTIGAKLIGQFGDDFASKALGFGCFTGQTKKLGNMKDYLPENASEQQTKDFLNSLEAFMKTTEVYESAAAEDEIRIFLREHPKQDRMNPSSARLAEQIAREEAKAKKAAAEEAEHERKAAYDRQVAEYERKLAENQREVAAAAEAQRQFEAGLAETQRQNEATRLAAAEAQREFQEKQAQYERERAAWEAQTAKLRK